MSGRVDTVSLTVSLLLIGAVMGACTVHQESLDAARPDAPGAEVAPLYDERTEAPDDRLVADRAREEVATGSVSIGDGPPIPLDASFLELSTEVQNDVLAEVSFSPVVLDLPPEALDVLCRLVYSENEWVAMRAECVLAKHFSRSVRAVYALLGNFDHPSSYVRVTAIDVMFHFGDAAEYARLELLNEARSEGLHESICAARSIILLGWLDEASISAVCDLYDGVGARKWYVRARLIEAMRDFPGEEVPARYERLIERGLEDPERYVREVSQRVRAARPPVRDAGPDK